ncbi:hypothetical protein L579_3116 [Pantoea sp. AS-PWVM4]|nr:hypothetical protein L579_3116 [Pantoea sp. AS-PWVM4]
MICSAFLLKQPLSVMKVALLNVYKSFFHFLFNESHFFGGGKFAA